MYRIIAVCTGNICRSPMAEHMLAQALDEAGLGDQTTVDSAGTTGWEIGRPIDQRAGERLAQAGITVENHRARQFEAAWYAERDLILALDVDHYEELREGAPDDAARDKVRLWRSFDPAVSHLAPTDQGIYDPWFGEASDFDASWQMIDSALKGIVEFVRKELDAR